MGEFVNLAGEGGGVSNSNLSVEWKRERGEGTYERDSLDEVTCDFSDDFIVIILMEHSPLPTCCARASARTVNLFTCTPDRSDG